MLKKRQRLSRREFEHLIKKGKRVHGEYFSIMFLENSRAKCGVVVAKKVAKKAVKRNTLRRQVYAVLGEHLPTLQRTHVAVFLKNGSANLPFSQMQEKIGTLLKTITKK